MKENESKGYTQINLNRKSIKTVQFLWEKIKSYKFISIGILNFYVESRIAQTNLDMNNYIYKKNYKQLKGEIFLTK